VEKRLETKTTRNDVPFRIGITGGIGAGKSHVRNLLASRGYCCLDADFLVSQAVLLPEIQLKIKELFGPQSYLDGRYNRAFVREKVFADPQLKEKLERLLHPAVRTMSEQAFQQVWSWFPKAWCFYEASLLIESGAHQNFDTVVLVTCNTEVRLQRVMRRNGFSEAQAKAILESQTDDRYKLPFCEFRIDNSGSELELFDKVTEFVQSLTEKFSRSVK
jgi:dephospho-CoA kinase